ncbi:MAG: fatty acid hydroxylase family protein [Pseudomonadota bacterium]
MSTEQAAFRAAYRAGISPRYNGVAHFIFVFGVGFGLIAWALHQVDGGGWSPLAAPLTLLLANINEWHIHKHYLHKRGHNRLAQLVWHRHTVEHHHYFTDQEMRVDSTREYRIILFPAYGVLLVALQAAALAALAALVFGANTAWIVFASGVFFFMWYEGMHFLCHVDESALVRHLPLVNTMRRNHMVHHCQALMTEQNMNLTFPFADWLFGSSDLQRGLWGTLFNGYSNAHLRPDIAERYRRLGIAPPVPHAQARPCAARSRAQAPAQQP